MKNLRIKKALILNASQSNNLLANEKNILSQVLEKYISRIAVL